MYIRITLLLSALFFTACVPTSMAILPGLETNSTKYKITEKPGLFSGNKIVFSPYSATNISRSWVSSTNSGMKIGSTKINNKNSSQDYTYQFNGKNSWNGDCEVNQESSKIGIFSGGLSYNLSCTFSPIESKDNSLSSWQFSFKGESPSTSTATINLKSKTIIVKAINKMQGSSIKLGQNTGYYFYSDEKIIAGVDALSNEGPVWLNNNLSEDEKDTIGMVIAALLLNQTNQ